MQTYLNKGIKEIIEEFPAVENILDAYGIGCGPCNVGLCLLKDIVQIHRLSADQEQQLMARIAQTIYPAKDVALPADRLPAPAQAQPFKYSPPMQKLVDEHALIKRWLAVIPEFVKQLDVESEKGRQLVLDGIDMIRAYADQYHHAKEEEILFKYFDEKSAILQAMVADHRQARSHVKGMLKALDSQDRPVLTEHLLAYGQLLSEHIRKEDEILYPWMDENLSTRQIGELFARFMEADAQIGFSPAKYEAFVNRLEEKFKPQEMPK